VVLRQAQQRHPGDVWINYDLARSLEKLARRDEPIRYHTAARSIRPETAHNQTHNLAHTLGYKGERDEEIAIFEDLRRLRPGSGRHLGCLGRALQDQCRSQAAAAILEAAAAANREALRMRPDDAYAHFSLGFALFIQGKPEEAIAEYRIAGRPQLSLVDAHMGLGEIFEFQGKRDEAIVEYRVASRLQPNLADAHNNISWAMGKKPDCGDQEWREALEHARLAFALSPKDGNFCTTLAEYRAGHWAESIAAAQQSIALTKGVDASIGFFLVMALWQNGDTDEARKRFDKAVAWTTEQDPTNVELHQFRAEAAERLEQPLSGASGPGSPWGSRSRQATFNGGDRGRLNPVQSLPCHRSSGPSRIYHHTRSTATQNRAEDFGAAPCRIIPTMRVRGKTPNRAG
jgi:tetratricopeptide (TPR) repeat protein